MSDIYREVYAAIADTLEGLGFREIFPPGGPAGDLPAREYLRREVVFKEIVRELRGRGKAPEICHHENCRKPRSEHFEERHARGGTSPYCFEDGGRTQMFWGGSKAKPIE